MPFEAESSFLLAALLLFVAGALLPIAAKGNPGIARVLGFGTAALASLCAFAAGVLTLLGVPQLSISLAFIPGIGSLLVGANALSALFLSIISFVAFAASVYSIEYAKEYERKGYSVSRLAFLHNLFILSMALVVTAQNALLFLVFWEAMALVSYFLVTFEYRDKASGDAGFAYLLITHLGTAFLILMFLILGAYAGSLDFADFASAQYPSFIASVVFVFALLGFGAKAGLIPLHVWLPLAHPQAPSSVSALMSGVMLKTGVYGVVLVLFSFLAQGPQTPLWWGVLLLALGAVSSVMGVLYSLLEHDLKRMLAMHSIENIGIIFLGIGSAALFSSLGVPSLAALSLFAALYHTLNHALFKSLLFLGAGSIAYSAHTRNLEHLGGLAKLMPITAMMFFVGSASIAAIPPLNGFASEWLTFQALLSGAGNPTIASPVFAIAFVLLAVTSALAVAAFVKAFGISFLGLPRSQNAAHAKEVPPSMLFAMAVLAIACIATGIMPSAIASLSLPALADLGFAQSAVSTQAFAAALPTPAIFALLAIISAIVFSAIYLIGKISRAKHEVGDTWDCGVPVVTHKMQYSATGFAMPVVRAFARWLNPLMRPDAYGSQFFDYAVYRPATRLFLLAAPLSHVLQTGRLFHYLLYLMASLGIVLFFALI